MDKKIFPLFYCNNLSANYGKKPILNGINIEINSGEIVCIIGHNGAGKSTLMKAIYGLIEIRGGEIYFDNHILKTPYFPSPKDLRHLGIVYVPQSQNVFPDLTIIENLEMSGIAFSKKKQFQYEIERVLDFFPDLKSRLQHKAANLSGGQKQMLALATALVISPRLLMLDEPSLGLAAPILSKTFEVIKQISKDFNVAILIIEQKVREVLKISQRVYILRSGTISFSGTVQMLNDETLRSFYL